MLKSSVGTDCLKCNKVISIFPNRFKLQNDLAFPFRFNSSAMLWIYRLGAELQAFFRELFRELYSAQSFALPRLLDLLHVQRDFFLLQSLINSFVIQGAWRRLDLLRLGMNSSIAVTQRTPVIAGPGFHSKESLRKGNHTYIQNGGHKATFCDENSAKRICRGLRMNTMKIWHGCNELLTTKIENLVDKNLWKWQKSLS